MRLQGKTIAVLHDIIPLRMKHAFYSSKAEGCRINVEDILLRASRIVTVSEFSRNDIADFFGIDKNRIDVVYNGVNADEFSRHNVTDETYNRLREKYCLPSKYVLYFGGWEPRKNLEGVISAYSLLPPELRRIYQLVVTNPSQGIKDLAQHKGISEDVHFISNIPAADKPRIYQMASVSLWLSFYEGFGLPVIEAQASGVPVICSNVTSMPEVAGDAAILVDPHDTKAIASAIERVLTDEALREALIAKGYENIKRFSWDESAQKLHDIILNV